MGDGEKQKNEVATMTGDIDGRLDVLQQLSRTMLSGCLRRSRSIVVCSTVCFTLYNYSLESYVVSSVEQLTYSYCSYGTSLPLI
jgi:hypothetical protein